MRAILFSAYAGFPMLNTKQDAIQKTKIAIIGAGFGGLAMAIRLLQNQQQNFVILEKSNDVGGTWRENRYPGAACDVQSHMYSLSFAPKTDWTKRYAEGPEIFNYIQDITQKYKIKDYCKFNHDVTHVQYDETRHVWTLDFNDQPSIEAQFVVFASGPLHIPQIPPIKGIEKFKGKVFHSSKWEHDYDLNGKSVASIGTGGSAIQYIPEIAKDVKQLYVFQRTAAWVIPRDERKYSSLSKALFKSSNIYRQIHRSRLYWSNESRVVPIVQPQIMKYGQKLAEAFIRFQVKDKELAKKLTPDFVMGCKRILISNKYFPTFNRKNVELVTDSIQEIKENSIVTKDGRERPIDCLIYGTGFITDPRIYLKHFTCIGRNQIELKQAWKDGAESYYGIMTKNFPNLFQLVGPNTVLGHNSIIFMIESQVNYILQLIQLVEESSQKAIEIKPEIQDAFNERVQKQLQGTVWQAGGCSSWYQSADGRNFSLWPTYTWKYWLETRKVKPKDYLLLNKSSQSYAV
ncbi:NAD(P)/FAD-dependent oxidoreductase [Acinetobacter pittii]|uniref:NAD(P)/FAD-dependent oxidoreductase n=1 Tax=Acinetobacter pittii TaxID=48296 RepID=A0AB37TKF7_ACIPI|nr:MULTISPECIES: NAD(P)/FAD-dependent oxidoreductase [Acinetobacter]MBM0875161.1 NAD(P)/FAD-dependent oxidoreductase [Acinetobacter pittii]MBN6519686.1 NAD(P)/FAD-dependent oxidoreductase [Acinetobacter pittii]MCG9484305.1 NAD(P)/FAD-dependent oxidoreductase [Acinetobacter pittii]MCK0924148.1 NAD(P)/FAD-dependent oxidoreductase [Acinetobacter pittii]MCU4618037.1 NAD(P)/FAD-dependent oxidoreductase [Acinetobacter pittii]